MKNYRADSCSVGEGWTDPVETARLWNKHIVPVLMANTDFSLSEDPEPPTVSVGSGVAAYADQWAWEEFCSRESGESEAATIQLANELIAKFGTKKAAAAMGSVKSAAKTAAARENAKKPRPGAQGKPKPRKPKA